MITFLLRHLVVFLLGAGICAAVLRLQSTRDGQPALDADAPAKEKQSPALDPEMPAIASTDIEPSSRTSEERARRLFESALPVLRQFGGPERSARADLLLRQLLREGDAGIAVLRKFLESGEDLPLARYALARVTYVRGDTLRMRILQELSMKSGQAPANEREKWGFLNGEFLRSLKTAATFADVERCVSWVESSNPGTARADAIAAVQRLASAPDFMEGTSTPSDLVNVTVHYGSVELLSILEAAVLKRPDRGLGTYLGAMWGFPEQVREERTARLLSNESMATTLQDYPPFFTMDFRLPVVRKFAGEWFNSSASMKNKAQTLSSIGAAAGLPYGGLGRKQEPPPGSPGTPPQVEARLAFLEEVSTCCPDGMFQRQISEARESLKKQIAGPPQSR